jgi:hypothetical protein
MNILFPRRGYHKGVATEQQPEGTTPFILNMRLIDTQDSRDRGGQRGGLQKGYTQLIGGEANKAIMWMGYITVVD